MVGASTSWRDPITRGFGPFAFEPRPDVRFRAGPRTRRSRATPDAPTLERLKLKPKEAAELALDPEKIVARKFRTKLMKPTKRTRASAASTAWGIEAIGASSSTEDGSGVVVAVLDTGINKEHRAFAGIESRIAEKDFSGEGNGDRDGHGTHCAGTIFGQDVDGKRIGVARNISKALIGKVLDDKGRGDSGMLVDGMLWAQKQGAHIISMSLGFDFPGEVRRFIEEDGYPADIAASAALEAYGTTLRLFDATIALLRALAPLGDTGGTVVVAATGNESRRDENAGWVVNASPPSSAEGLLSVGAVRNGTRYAVADFSNSLPKLVAPGVEVLSADAKRGGLMNLDGTSMATPHVAGAAALWWQRLARSGAASAETVMARLIATATDADLRASDRVERRGSGLVTCP